MKKASILIISLLLWSCWGCVPAPREGAGGLSLEVRWGAGARLGRSPDEIAAVTAILTRQELTVTGNLLVADGSATGSFTGLYAGDWQLRVDAATADGIIIYTGQMEVTILDGQTAQAGMTLRPAPGSLEVRLDAAPLLAAGHTVAEGRVYIYKNPETNNSSSYELKREGDSLHGVIEGLAPMTYEARVAVPQITNSIFTSKFFSFSVSSGRTTLVEIGATGGVNVSIDILVEPGRVSGLSAISAGGQVNLTWNGVAGATGYRIYRTNDEGRYVHLALVDGGVTSYMDNSYGEAEPYGGAVWYAVAALAGDLEGIRSDPVAVTE